SLGLDPGRIAPADGQTVQCAWLLHPAQSATWGPGSAPSRSSRDDAPTRGRAMTAIDIAALRRHIGTRISDEDMATEAPLKAIVATFDRPEAAPGEGQPIPPGWHIGYFLSTAPTSTLAADGLPMGAGVLPKIPLPRRMYAGSRFTFHAPILVGDRLRREIELEDLQVREGSTGTLILTTQARRIFTPRGL